MAYTIEDVIIELQEELEAVKRGHATIIAEYEEDIKEAKRIRDNAQNVKAAMDYMTTTAPQGAYLHVI